MKTFAQPPSIFLQVDYLLVRLDGLSEDEIAKLSAKTNGK